MRTMAHIIGSALPTDAARVVEAALSRPENKHSLSSKYKQHKHSTDSSESTDEETICLKLRSLIVFMENLLEQNLDSFKKQNENRWNQYGAPWLKLTQANQNESTKAALQCYKRRAARMPAAQSPITTTNRDSRFLYAILLDLRNIEANGQVSLRMIPAENFIESLRISIDAARGIGH